MAPHFPALRFVSVVGIASVLLLGASIPALAATSISGTGNGSVLNEDAASPLAITPASAKPYFAISTPDGAHVYAGAVGNAGIASQFNSIDTSTNATTATVPFGVQAAITDGAFAPDGSKLYTIPYGTSTLYTIDTATNTSTNLVLGFSGQVQGLAMSPDGTRIWGAMFNGLGTIVSFDPTTGALISTLDTTNANVYNVAVSPDGKKVYASGLSGKLGVVDVATNTYTQLTSSGTGQYPNLAVSPDGKTVVATHTTDEVIFYDVASGTVTSLPVVGQPTGVAISPNSLFAYVTLRSTDELAVIDLTTKTVVATVPTGDEPYSVAVLPNGSALYVTDSNTNTVTIIDLLTLTVTAPASVDVGTATLPASLALAGGGAPMSFFTTGTEKVEVLDSAGTVVATSTGTVNPDATGASTIPVPISGLAPGTYSVRATFSIGATGVVVAVANGLIIHVALAATGLDARPYLAVGAVLLLFGIAALAFVRLRRSR